MQEDGERYEIAVHRGGGSASQRSPLGLPRSSEGIQGHEFVMEPLWLAGDFFQPEEAWVEFC